MKTTVALLFGGKSVEHEVSVISGIQAYKHMDTDKYDVIPVYITKNNDMYIGEGVGDIASYKDIPALLKKSRRVVMLCDEGNVYLAPYPMKNARKNIPIDVAFPVVHGTNVEDGALQGYLKTVGIPFVGCDVTASAVGMDKYVQKQVLKDNNVPVLDAKLYNTGDYADIDGLVADIEKRFGYPVIVKPVNLGSSVGIGIAHDKIKLVAAIDDAFRYSSKILVEHAISKLREINCSVVGDDVNAEASECEEPFHSSEMLDFHDKYERGGKGSKGSGMANLARKIPADITDEQRSEIRSLAVRAFKALGCNGVARIDFMIDEENGKLYFNEINTIPGSLSFYLWEPLGVPYKELLDRVITLALKRKRENDNLVFTFDTNILSNAGLSGSKGSKR